MPQGIEEGPSRLDRYRIATAIDRKLYVLKGGGSQSLPLADSSLRDRKLPAGMQCPYHFALLARRDCPFCGEMNLAQLV